MTPAKWLPVGESAVLIQFGNDISDELADRVQRACQALTDSPVVGVVDLVPAYASLLVAFDPETLDGEALKRAVSRADREDAVFHPAPPVVWEIPVIYGGALGPDLESAARALSLTPEEVVRLHTGETYRVHALGYAPGFPYLGVLPDALRLPRRADPRDKVPAGSVAMADRQTGIFPVSRPSGWHLLGWTPVRLFRRDSKNPFVLAPSDRVCFKAVSSADDWTDRAIAKNKGERRSFVGAGARTLDPAGPALLRVKDPGHRTLVQDLGRTGYSRYGMPVGGAMDADALQIANLLAGNERGAAALESVWEGPTLEALRECWIGIAGAATLPRKNGKIVPNPGRVRLEKGDVLRVGRVVHGLHVYVAVSGGIAAERFLGSAATYVPAQVGGIGGNVIRRGAVLSKGTSRWNPPRAEGPLPGALREPASNEPVLRALPGPHAQLFRKPAMKALFSSRLSFTPRSDRTGLRLSGALLPLRERVSLASFGVVRGALQVPPTGEPILLASDAHAVGGYPIAAVVIQSDLPKLAQIQPGDPFRLQQVTKEEAVAALASRREWLDSVERFASGQGLFAAWSELHDMIALEGTAEASFAGTGVSIRIARSG